MQTINLVKAYLFPFLIGKVLTTINTSVVRKVEELGSIVSIPYR